MLLLLWMCLVCSGGTLQPSLVEARPSGTSGKSFKVTGTGTVEGDTTLLELHFERDGSLTDRNGASQQPATLPAIRLRLSDKTAPLNTHDQNKPIKNHAQLIAQQKLHVPVGLTAYEDEMVMRHNHYRQIHASPPLRYDKELAAYAKIHANRLATIGSLVHENQTILKARNQGENLGSRCSYLPINSENEERKSIRKIVKKWYNEVCQYNFETPSFQRNIGHFSQVDWSGSRDIGVGVAFSTNKKGMNCMYVVGRYRPAGNVDSPKAFQRNVHQGVFHRMSYCQSQVLADENV